MATNSYYKYLLTFSLGGILFTACTEKAAEETPKKEPKIAQENTKQTDKKDDSESKTSDLASTDKNEEKEKRVIFIPPVVQEPDPLPRDPYPRDPEPYAYQEPYGVQEPPVPPAEKKRQEEEILIVVEEPAEFPGGMAEMRLYLAKNIVYPTTAMELAIEGKVYLRFNVMIDGSINSVNVLKGIKDCPECDKEAVRVVKAMPKWKPAKNIGKAVNSQMTIPVIFKLQ